MDISPDQYPPLLIVDSNHHGAWVAISAAIGLTITFFCLLIRLYVRLAISPPFGKDDVTLVVASVSRGAFSNSFTPLTDRSCIGSHARSIRRGVCCHRQGVWNRNRAIRPECIGLDPEGKGFASYYNASSAKY